MQNITEVRWLKIVISFLLFLLVLVLSVTGYTNTDQDKLLQDKDLQIEKIEQQKEKLKVQLEAKREAREKKVAEKLKVVPVVSKTGNEAVMVVVYATFWKDSRFATLIACESGFRANAVGYDGHPYYQYNYGLFQVASGHGYSAEYLFNPMNNIKVAKEIYLAQGFSAWPNCSRVAGFV